MFGTFGNLTFHRNSSRKKHIKLGSVATLCIFARSMRPACEIAGDPKPSKDERMERMANRKRLIVLRCPVTEQERDLIFKNGADNDKNFPRMPGRC